MIERQTQLWEHGVLMEEIIRDPIQRVPQHFSLLAMDVSHYPLFSGYGLSHQTLLAPFAFVV